jgi:hypothetical protein
MCFTSPVTGKLPDVCDLVESLCVQLVLAPTHSRQARPAADLQTYKAGGASQDALPLAAHWSMQLTSSTKPISVKTQCTANISDVMSRNVLSRKPLHTTDVEGAPLCMTQAELAGSD